MLKMRDYKSTSTQLIYWCNFELNKTKCMINVEPLYEVYISAKNIRRVTLNDIHGAKYMQHLYWHGLPYSLLHICPFKFVKMISTICMTIKYNLLSWWIAHKNWISFSSSSYPLQYTDINRQAHQYFIKLKYQLLSVWNRCCLRVSPSAKISS